MKFLKNNKGFTLIELVLIIVILGVLSSVAVVEFTDLATDAEAASNAAYVGALSSAISIRFAEQLIRGDADPDVIGNTALLATAELDDITGMVTSPMPDSISVETAGACGVGILRGYAPGTGGTAPYDARWTLTCGAAATDPVSLVLSAV